MEAPDQLLANPRNWRVHPKAQETALAAVLDEVGWVQNVIVNQRTGNVVDGHLRVSLAISRGEATVPVVYVDLDENEEGLVLATIDPLSAMAGTDKDLLAQLLGDVVTSSADLQAMLDATAAGAGVKRIVEGLTDPDELPAEVETRSKRGDLWLLGEHRVLCGDATSAEDVGRVMAGESVALCFTSPPYAQQRDYGAVIEDWDALMTGVFANVPVSDSGQVLVNLGLVHRDGEWMPYWTNWIEWMRTQGWRRFGWYVWDQMRGLPGDWNGRLAPSFEFIFHFNRESVRPVKHVATKADRAERERSQVARGSIKTGLRAADGSVHRLTSPQSVGQTHKVPDNVLRLERHMANDIARRNHPATFPVSLPAFVATSWPGDVYDPFLGSGTTLIACEQLGRKCYGLEIEPKYVDVILQRWENFTGKTAVLDG